MVCWFIGDLALRGFIVQGLCQGVILKNHHEKALQKELQRAHPGEHLGLTRTCGDGDCGEDP